MILAFRFATILGFTSQNDLSLTNFLTMKGDLTYWFEVPKVDYNSNKSDVDKVLPSCKVLSGST